jgi:hypothetical protein
LRDRDEYRVGLGMLDILLFPVPAVNAIGVELMVAEIVDIT